MSRRFYFTNEEAENIMNDYIGNIRGARSMAIFDLGVPADYNTIRFDFSQYKKLASIEKREHRASLAERAEHRSQIRNISVEQALAELTEIDKLMKGVK